MMLLFQRLRRDEEGQTLVLAAIFGLVLALCVLGTVNLGRAVFDKVQVQTACDDGAYSQAAVEARVLNFTAYTNRAMVVHYASIMSATSYLTWLHFSWPFVHGLMQLGKLIPYVGAVFNALDQLFKAVIKILDWALSLFVPFVSAANIALWGLQEGAWMAVYAGRLGNVPPEAHSGDTPGHNFKPIWPTLLPLANQTVFSQVRGGLTMPQNLIDSAQVLINDRSDRVQLARLHMIEIANSARPAWTAYGDRYSNPSFSPLARHWQWKVSFLGQSVSVGAVARTELGSFAPSGGISGAINATGQVFSGSRAQLDWSILGSHGPQYPFGILSFDDMVKNLVTTPTKFFGGGGGSGIIGKILNTLFKGIFKSMVTYAQTNAKVSPDTRLFLISPYVSMQPRAASRPGGGIRGKIGNFGQPDVIFGLAKEGRDYNADPGAARGYGSRHSVNLGAGTGTVDYSYTNADQPRLPGVPGNLQILHKGFNALCAAQAYYHRPGDWREMPNLFNPLWGARLMPVLESNGAAALGLSSVPLIQNMILH